mmetsp:Transcript_30100/g.64986  ORF Transcript_30100/g.64986 Transcript_30100/m.64986 type:complete len:117 (-) Transcript_30100:95-445(-)
MVLCRDRWCCAVIDGVVFTPIRYFAPKKGLSTICFPCIGFSGTETLRNHHYENVTCPWEGRGFQNASQIDHNRDTSLWDDSQDSQYCICQPCLQWVFDNKDKIWSDNPQHQYCAVD